MDINDLMPGPNSRPNHPDFWKLAAIVLAYDASIDEQPSSSAREEVWRKTVGESFTDANSLTYMATQRALRALEVQNIEQLAARREQVAALAAMWIEGYLVGSKHEQSRHKE